MEIPSTVRRLGNYTDSRFEARLASVFTHLHTIYASFDGRIKADNFRRQVIAVTSAWETWMVFNNNSVEAWVKTFLGRTDVEEQADDEPIEQIVEKPAEKRSRWKSVAETSGKEIAEASGPLNAEDENVDGEEMEEEDVDGIPMDEDVDGEPMEKEDVDGDQMEDEEVDVKPMEESTVSAPVATPEPIPRSPERTVGTARPLKRQRMRAVDMFPDD